ncbi:hypothetical protein BaRGS_00032203, partial [Batillaria attramentaria]
MLHRWFLRVFLCVSYCSLAVNAGKIAGVCEDVVAVLGQPERPVVPARFYVHVECNMLDRNYTAYVTEWYDQGFNYGRVHQLQFMEEGDMYFDYEHNQLITVDRYSGDCTVDALNLDINSFMFGVNTSASGQERIYAPSGALHFGDAPEVYVGTDVVRGIAVDVWNSCQYSPTLDATMNVTWYFSSNSSWDMQLGFQSVPVRAHVVGRRNDPGGGSHAFEHIYDLFDFATDFDTTHLQLRSGDYCPGRYNKHPFPPFPDVFSIIGEMLDYDLDSTKTIEEHYDLDNKINVYRYKDKRELGLLTGQNDRTEINDFNEGIAYIINEQAGTCQLRDVSEGNYAFVDINGGTSVRQQTPAEFFLTNNVNFYYLGVETVRGITCDTWIGMSNHTTGYMGREVKLEWYFATVDYQLTGGGSEYRVPILFRLWKHKPSYTYNAFGFDTDRPLVANLDVSPCFHGSERAEVQFDFSASYKSVVTSNVENFKTACMTAVSDFLGISPLRVANLK